MAENMSISMSMDSLNSTENRWDKGISLYPNYTVESDLLIYLCFPVWLSYELSPVPCEYLRLDLFLTILFSIKQLIELEKKKRLGALMWCNAT